MSTDQNDVPNPFPDAAIHPPAETIAFYREACNLTGADLWHRIVDYSTTRRIRVNVHFSRVYFLFRARVPALAASLREQEQYAQTEDSQFETAGWTALGTILSEWEAAIDREIMHFEDLLLVYRLLPRETWQIWQDMRRAGN
ncbi:hypothetical protein FS749_007894 [Ceratobasidium sp. UAMH 11750]|nr:hypothetical protein FS749_007894 [Ceratobasidium sp. UAMH 11750]